MKVPITITIEQSTVSKVDEARGMVPRSRVLERAIDIGVRTLEREALVKESI